MAEDGGDSDIATKPVEAVENKKPEKQKKYSSVFGEQFKADERYMPKNRVFKKRRNGFVNFVTRPVTIFAAFLAVVVGANLWYYGIGEGFPRSYAVQEHCSAVYGICAFKRKQG